MPRKRSEQTSKEVAKKAAAILKDPNASADAKSVAASALTQAPNKAAVEAPAGEQDAPQAEAAVDESQEPAVTEESGSEAAESESAPETQDVAVEETPVEDGTPEETEAEVSADVEHLSRKRFLLRKSPRSGLNGPIERKSRPR